MAESDEFKWYEQRVRDNEAFQELLKRKSCREKLFDDKFIEALERRRDVLVVKSSRIMLLQLTLSLMLAVSVFVPDLSITMFGLSSKAANLREFLLVVTGAVPIYGMLASIEHSRLTDAMIILLQDRAEGDPDALRLLKLRYGILSELKIPDVKGRTLSKYQKVFMGVGATTVFVWFVVTALAFMSLEFVVMISILVKPSVSTTVSLLVCLYIVVLNIANFGIRAAMGILSTAASPDKAPLAP
ncbi:hypothetical protein ACJMQP_28225 [Rhodopseudomonas palustris]